MGGVASIFKGPKKPPDPPDPGEVARADAAANRFNVIGPDGTRQQLWGHFDGDRFVEGTPPEGQIGTMMLNESADERRARDLQENIGINSLRRGESISRDLMNGPRTLLYGGLPAMPDAPQGANATAGVANLPNVVRSNITSGASDLPSDRVTDPDMLRDAVYDQAYSLMLPDLDRQERRTRTAMADRGLPMDGEAYQGEMDRLDRNRGETLSRLGMMAIQAAENQRNANFGQQLALRGTTVGENLSQNAVDRNAFADQLGLRATGVNENMAQAQLEQQDFANALTARQTTLGEREADFNFRLNQLQAALGGAPQFSRQTIAPSPVNVSGIYNSNYAQRSANANAANATNAGTLGSLFQLGGTLGSAWLGA